ncbi:MAG TPA: hypothetical protein VMN36_10265 [Verrucomicrobiales bacterium]|nr:hypothetical protein [Verrucomicrobiales bacterium]
MNHLIQKHLRIGWGGLLVFLSLGILLETLHGLKLDFYLDVRNSTRRLMWTLAHAHGALFSIIHIAFAATLPRLAEGERALRLSSRSLTAALILVPAGFFLGGYGVKGGDPGLGIVLVPAGAIGLFLGVALTFRACFPISPPRPADAPTPVSRENRKSTRHRKTK